MRTALTVIAGLALAQAAVAQVSVDVAVLSDYRFRGVSESDLGPAVQGSLSLDHRSGLFAGVFASSVDLDGSRLKVAAFGGLAGRGPGDLSWEAGAVHYRYPGARTSLDYSEAFVGLGWRRLSARGYYAPDFFGRSLRSTYLELNARHWLDERASVFARVGVARFQTRGLPYASNGDTRVDGSVGVTINVRASSLEIAAVATNEARTRCPLAGRCGVGIVVALSHGF